MSTRDPYESLGVPRGATREDIRKAYRRLAREHHPDANPGDPAAEGRFKEIKQAYDTLSNPANRKAYEGRSSPRRKRAGAPRTTAGTSRRTAGSINLSDLISKRANVSGPRTGGSKQIEWQLGDEDLARISKVLGIDLARLSKLAGDHVQMNARVSFGDEAGRKPPKPPKKGKPPGA